MLLSVAVSFFFYHFEHSVRISLLAPQLERRAILSRGGGKTYILLLRFQLLWVSRFNTMTRQKPDVQQSYLRAKKGVSCVCRCGGLKLVRNCFPLNDKSMHLGTSMLRNVDVSRSFVVMFSSTAQCVM